MRALCGGYVETFRNVPLLLQLFIWYFVMTELLPASDAALHPFSGAFLSKNGFQFVIPVWEDGHWFTLAGAVTGASGAWAWARAMRRQRDATGQAWPLVWPGAVIVFACALLGWLMGGAPSLLDLSRPGMVDRIAGSESNAETRFAHLDSLWAEPAGVRRRRV